MKSKNPYKETSLFGKKSPKKSKINRRKRLGGYFLTIFLIFLLIFLVIKNLLPVYQTLVKYYMVFSPVKANDFATAETYASETKARGGAGVVIKDEGKFFIVLAVYPEKKFAEIVVSQLAKQGTVAEVGALNIKALKTNSMKKENAQIATTIQEKYKETLEELYHLTKQLDSNEISQSVALMRVGELALLWEQRTQSLADKIDPSLDDKDNEHELSEVYSLSLYVASQLKYLANENTYQSSLKTLISVIRQINYMLCVI